MFQIAANGFRYEPTAQWVRRLLLLGLPPVCAIGIAHGQQCPQHPDLAMVPTSFVIRGGHATA